MIKRGKVVHKEIAGNPRVKCGISVWSCGEGLWMSNEWRLVTCKRCLIHKPHIRKHKR